MRPIINLFADMSVSEQIFYYASLLLIFSVIVYSCSGKHGTSAGEGQHRIHDVEEVTIDGHQYLIYSGFEKGGITHKANCKANH